jgi:hypothetical protein
MAVILPERPFHLSAVKSWSSFLVILSLVVLFIAMSWPMIIQPFQHYHYNATANEAALMVSRAYHQYRNDHGLRANTDMESLLPYLKRAKREPFGMIDQVLSDPKGVPAKLTCSGVSPYVRCLRLKNGALLMYEHNPNTLENGFGFGGYSSRHAITFSLDPDGHYTGEQNTVQFFLMADGRLHTLSDVPPKTQNAYRYYDPIPNTTPRWFRWRVPTTPPPTRKK